MSPLEKAETHTTMSRSSCRIASAVAIIECLSFSVGNWIATRPSGASAAQAPPEPKANIIREITYTRPGDLKIGRGNYLVVTNFRNEKLFFDRRKIEPYKPVIVVGLDGEKNLFRLGVFYQALREYSWKPGPQPPLMTRPVGAFVHFLEAPPPELTRQGPYNGLTENSFQRVEQDPVASLGDLPKEVYEAVTARNGCVYCHSFRGIGSQSHHMTASENRPHGGVALPLESYPESVWKDFVFHQEEAAAKIGASPNVVDEEARQALYDLVVESRKKQQAPAK